MDAPPISLSIVHLSPYTLLPPSTSTTLQHDASASASSTTPAPPPGFVFSPTHNYPAPFPAMSLGSTLRVGLSLRAVLPAAAAAAAAAELDEGPRGGVRGVRMMCEVQGPGGRYRLGEVVYGEQEEIVGEGKEKEKADSEAEAELGTPTPTTTGLAPEPEPKPEAEAEPEAEKSYDEIPLLRHGEAVELDVSAEMKELGLQIVICSVAWETREGRRTFQRFFKLNVNAPLAIKTRVHTAHAPEAQLDPLARSDVFLEVLVQNTAADALSFTKVAMEPVYGLESVPVSSLTDHASVSHSHSASGASASASAAEGFLIDISARPLGASDTRQYLFRLRHVPPSPTRGGRLSAFPPFFAGGTILPLGRLDVAWTAGPYAEPGRLQTSTLNRRVPITPIAAPTPTRTTTALSPSPGAGAGGAPKGYTLDVRDAGAGAGPGGDGAGVLGSVSREEWEYDVVLLDVRREVRQEDEFVVRAKVSVRGLTPVQEDGEGKWPEAPPKIRLGVQYLLPDGEGHGARAPTPAFALSPPSRSGTPLSPPSEGGGGPSRAFSPRASGSRPSTPLSTQLRQAALSHLSPGGGTVPAPLGRPALLPPAPIDDFPSHASFPPAPYPANPTTRTHSAPSHLTGVGEVYYLGNTLARPPAVALALAQEQYHTTYAESVEPPVHWEGACEVEWRFVALREGLAGLGGVRVLFLGLEGEGEGEVWEGAGGIGVMGRGAKVEKEWESLGDVYVRGS